MHLDVLDAVVGQPGRRTADRAQVEAAVLPQASRDLLSERFPLASITMLPPWDWNRST